MFEFDLTYFLKEFETFRALYGKVSKDQLDLAYKALMHLYTITIPNNLEDENVLRSAYNIATDEWFRYRDLGKIEK